MKFTLHKSELPYLSQNTTLLNQHDRKTVPYVCKWHELVFANNNWKFQTLIVDHILTWFSFILVHFDQATSDRNICKMYPYLYKILNMQKMLGLQLTGYIYICMYTSKKLIERQTLGGMLVISK